MSKALPFLLAFALAPIAQPVMAFTWDQRGKPSTVTFTGRFSGLCAGCDMSNRRMDNAHMSSGNFAGSNFSGSVLRSAEMTAGNFAGTRFDRGDLGPFCLLFGTG